ncbi:hypothetical protein [Vibrio furnissii]|uniref:hypothetical protein n=1 Tax=Vibrio furnissii TaxID=29494 RepID=UPI0001B930DA|nr:hypothetical protein [Vibrio furnissii]EEX41778.1 hypothetical protein VFA_001615 [Vibrio furnissii CIP 102972]SUP45380.1 Uncharacterised protein [Vibrio furnissii]
MKPATKQTKTYIDNQSCGLSAHKPNNPYSSIKSQTWDSQSEIALTIQSDKSVTVGKTKCEKGTSPHLDVGNLGWRD